MLLLVTIFLVLVAAVTLVIGIFSDTLTLIYVSIGSSFLAALVLVVLSQVSKRSREAGVVTAPEPALETTPGGEGRPAPEPTPVAAAQREPEGFPIPGYDRLSVPEILARLDTLNTEQLDVVAEREETGQNRAAILDRIDDRLEALEGPSAVAEAQIEEELAEADEELAAASSGFPIDDYDSLTVSQIVPQLDDLTIDELDMVAEREETGKARATILNRIDRLIDEREGVAAPVEAAPKKAAKKAAAKKATAKKAAPKKAAPKKASTKKSAAKKSAKKASGRKSAE